MKSPGYYRFPSIRADSVVFVSEDDLWHVPTAGGLARRLTSGLGAALYPAISPDRDWIAFSGREEGPLEVYLMPFEGGPIKRLTFLGGITRVLGWFGRKILFASNALSGFDRVFEIFTVNKAGGNFRKLPVGPGVAISFGRKGACVIGRNSDDPARWKRYRGGRMGELYMDRHGKGTFSKLVQTQGNMTNPMCIDDRVFFLSDHEGIGNVYSCDLEGKHLQRHTEHREFFARFPCSDEDRIIYSAGGDLFFHDLKKGRSSKISIEYPGPRTQLNRKFVECSRFLESTDIHPQGHLMTVTARGKIFSFGHFAGPILSHGDEKIGRYRLSRWLNDGKRLVAIHDGSGEEALEIHSADGKTKPHSLSKLDLGRITEIKTSPKADLLAVCNSRSEIILVDMEKETSHVVDRSCFSAIRGFDWSPDGLWLAFNCSLSLHTSIIKLYQLKTKKIFQVTRPVLHDVAPTFDPEGKYLFFLSYREFDPVYDNLHFDLGFPRGIRPYLVTLAKDTISPFVEIPKPAEEKPQCPDSGAKKAEEAPKKEPEPIKIDIEGIEDRIAAFPVPDGKYDQIAAIKGKALFSSSPVEGSLKLPWFSSDLPAKGKIEAYDFEAKKLEVLVNGSSSFQLSPDRKFLLYRAGNRLRLIKAGEKSDENLAKEPPGKKSGWIDLHRIRISVQPGDEWKQIFREAWRLQRDHYWTPDMAKIDWNRVYDRYYPLLERVGTRAEFSDLLWEMQGELGTSHAYEMGGDYRLEPHFSQGFLGADFEWVSDKKVWRLKHLVRGDPWEESRTSPLRRPGVNVSETETILAINGRKLTEEYSPAAALVQQANQEIQINIGDSHGKETRVVAVKAASGEQFARYRDWVEANRACVREKTGGRVGYVHILNMGPVGYSEFHRYFLAEIDREGLIVDVRYNGGGHVSQLILEKLARKRIAYVQSRWFGAEPYPTDSIGGPMVALTNEYAGSDGDIFSHCFKILKLGPLIGKRTWGGVIGIWPRHAFVDGGLTTQPEFSFWFQDVGWEVENYGTDPDIEVDYLPQDYAAGKDPQLERGIHEILLLFKKHPFRVPDLKKARPNLALPTLKISNSTPDRRK